MSHLCFVRPPASRLARCPMIMTNHLDYHHVYSFVVTSKNFFSSYPVTTQDTQQNITQVMPKSAIGIALAYTLNLWNRLNGYLLDGKYEIDNNLIENSIRPVALVRKNYLFAGSHDAAQRTAMLYSFLGSCKMNDVEPSAWLKDVLIRLPDYKANKLHELLPNSRTSLE